MRRLWAMMTIAACALALAGAACGDGGSDGDDSGETPGAQTPGAGTPGVQTAPARNPTPFATPVIDGRLIRSPEKGFEATLPDGWKLVANQVVTFGSSMDVLFAPKVEGQAVQPNIQLNCILDKFESHAERAEFYKTNTVRIGLNSNIQVSEREVSGVPATVLSYRFDSQGQQTPSLDKQDIYFTSPKCDWIVTTTVPAGQFEQYRALFDTFIASFRITA